MFAGPARTTSIHLIPSHLNVRDKLVFGTMKCLKNHEERNKGMSSRFQARWNLPLAGNLMAKAVRPINQGQGDQISGRAILSVRPIFLPARCASVRFNHRCSA